MSALPNVPVAPSKTVLPNLTRARDEAALMQGFLTSAEVAELIRIPAATLRYWRYVGSGPKSFKMGPRRVLYRAEDVASWVAAQYADPS